MSSIEFIYEGISSIIQCKPEEKMSEIFSRYSSKSNLEINKLYFVSEGKVLKKELTYSETTKTNLIKVLVYTVNENEAPIANITKTKPKFIMCPTCYENTILNFDNCKINLSKCRNDHELKNILLNEFEEKQKYNMAQIKCQDCKNKNKSETAFNEFYKCLKCKMYLCPLCKSIHDKTHIIINMDKNYSCLRHNEPYSLYCKTCKINLCVQCPKEEHIFLNKIFFADIMPNIDNINNKMNELKNCINSFKQNIEEIITQLNSSQNIGNVIFVLLYYITIQHQQLQ